LPDSPPEHHTIETTGKACHLPESACFAGALGLTLFHAPILQRPALQRHNAAKSRTAIKRQYAKARGAMGSAQFPANLPASFQCSIPQFGNMRNRRRPRPRCCGNSQTVA